MGLGRSGWWVWGSVVRVGDVVELELGGSDWSHLC